ncbi:MAG: hypothetical protein ACTSRS_19450, partial [Candidatus Helarchaeota archaeon]
EVNRVGVGAFAAGRPGGVAPGAAAQVGHGVVVALEFDQDRLDSRGIRYPGNRDCLRITEFQRVGTLRHSRKDRRCRIYNAWQAVNPVIPATNIHAPIRDSW